MSKTKIEWAEHQWNPIRGCSVVSEGCKNCYAMDIAARFSGPGLPYEGLAYRNSSGAHWSGEVRGVPEKLLEPMKRKTPTRYFVNSMSDLFHEKLSQHWIDTIFGVMDHTPQHTYQILTKRPERMNSYCRWMADLPPKERTRRIYLSMYKGHPVEKIVGRLEDDYVEDLPWPLPNVWLGVSVEDQATAADRIPLLLQCPAAVRWISAEPLIGPIELTHLHTHCPTHDFSGGFCSGPCPDRYGLDWCVVGGESGPKARPMHPDWPRSLRDQCRSAGVPFFFKQWGEWLPRTQGGTAYGKTAWGCLEFDGTFWPETTTWNSYQEDGPDRESMVCRVGKKVAGRLLDGREWSEYPKEGVA